MLYKRMFWTLVVGLMLLVTMPALALVETFHQTYEVKPGVSLKVYNKNGSIDITAWDKSTVDVTAEKQSQMGGNVQDVQIEVTNAETFTIKTVYLTQNPRVSVKYTISVPGHMLVEHVESSNGTITVKGTAGDLTADTSNGALSLANLKGAATAKTSNGGITMEDIDGVVKADTSNGVIRLTRITGAVEAETSNGKIEVAEVAELVSLKTSNGSIKAEIPVMTQDAQIKTSNGAITLYLSPELQANLDLDTSNAKITISGIEIVTTEISKTSFKGRLGDGGKTLTVKTSNGAIDVFGLK